MKPKFNPFHRISLPLALMALICSQSVQADTTTTAWSGTIDTVWGTDTNWAGSVLPDDAHSALFNSTFANQPTLGAAQTTQGIWLASSVGQDVTINSAAAQTLTITGDAVLNSQTAAGIYMNDSANHNLTIGPNTSITLSNATGFYNQESTGTLTISGGLNLNGKALTIGAGATSTGNVAIGGNITSGGSLTINTAGTVTLSGASSTYSGGTTVTAGTLVVGTNSAVGTGKLTLPGGSTLQASTDVSLTNSTVVLSAGTTTFSGANSITIGGTSTGLIGGGDKTITNNLASGKTLTFSGNLGILINSTNRLLTIAGTGNTTFSGILSDGTSSGTAARITVTSTGTTTLSGNNTYSGITTVNAGNLVPTLATALPNYNSSGKVVFNGGVIVTKVGDGTTTGWSTGQIDSLLTNATKTSGKLGIDTSNGDVTQWTAFTGSAGNFGALGLTKLGANTLILTQNNTYTGATVISSGTLQLGDGTAGNDGSIGSTSSVTNNGTLFYNLNTTSSVGYAISGTGGLIKAGSGELQLNTAYKGITYTGPTWIQAGVLRVWQSYSTPLSRYTIDAAGALKLDQGGGRGITIGSLVGSGTVTLKGDLTLGGDNTTDANFTGRISQNGGTSRLLKNGSGTQTLSGSNSYYGTVVSEGTLRVGNANALGGGTLAVNGGALDLNGYSVGVTALSGSIGGLITSSTTGAITLTTSGTVDSVFAGVIEDGSATSVALSKTGAGTLTLSGTNTYTGGTNVSAGTLALAGGSETSPISVGGSAFIAFTPGTSITSSGDLTLASGAKVKITTLPGAGSYTLFTTSASITGTPVLDTTVSGYTLSLTVEGGNTLKLTAVAASGYDSWNGGNAGGQTPDLDWDSDGVSNGVEYFMNAAAGFTANPALGAGNIITWPNGGNIPASAYGTPYVVQTSGDLVIWTDVPVGDLTTNTSGPGGSLTYTLTGSGKRFVRLKVTPTP